MVHSVILECDESMKGSLYCGAGESTFQHFLGSGLGSPFKKSWSKLRAEGFGKTEAEVGPATSLGSYCSP